MQYSGCWVTRPQDVKELTALQRAIIRELAKGKQCSDVAKEMGVAKNTVSYTKNSDPGQQYYKELVADTEERIRECWERLDDLNDLAVKILRVKLEQIANKAEAGEILSHEEVRVAERHLHRQGFTQPTRVGVFHAHLGSRDVIEGIKTARAELAEAIDIQQIKSGDDSV
jgi:predicted transcriptional regulator